MFSSVHMHRLNKSIYTRYETEKNYFWDDGYEAKNILHTPGVKANLSYSMEIIVQLVKKSVTQIYQVLKQNKGWKNADSPCLTKSMAHTLIKSTMVSKPAIHLMTLFFQNFVSFNLTGIKGRVCLRLFKLIEYI